MSIVDDIIVSAREFERLLCASALVYPDVVRSECSFVTDSHFSNESLRTFWHKFVETGDAVASAIDTGVFSELIEISTNMPSVHHVEYARKVTENAYLRNIAIELGVIASAISNRDADLTKQTIARIHEMEYGGSHNLYTADNVDLAFRNIVASKNPAIKTYIAAIDSSIGGFFPPELIILAARPGMGKTSICLNIARNIAFSGKKVLFVSLEMSKEQVWARIACPLAGVEWSNARSGNITQAEVTKLEIESVALAARLGGNFLIHDELYALPDINQAAHLCKPDIIMIDQLPEIHWHGPETDEVKWYGLACKYIRSNIAKSLNIPAVLVHQLSRDVEGRQDQRPVLKDLRWSGEVEQRADVVLMAYREDYYEGRMQGVVNVPLELLVRKNRQGEMSQKMILNYNLKTQVIT